MDASSGADPSRCPLCGETNRCAMELARETGQAQAPCWCLSMDFPADLLERVPPAKRRLACICARCARAHAGEMVQD